MAQARDAAARPGRSAAAFRTISEVAGELDVPAHVLRFWESKFVQVKPLKRGGGRRYYRPEDIDLLRRIRELLYTEGYTIKGVQRLLRAGPDSTRVGQPRGAAAQKNPAGARNAISGAARTELQDILAELETLREAIDGADA